MKRANLFSQNSQQEGILQVSSVYESPCLKILNFRFDLGQSLLLYSEEMQGKVSMIVIEGHGEFVGEEARRYHIERGDVVVSEMSEPQSLLATTELRLLVAITPPAHC